MLKRFGIKAKIVAAYTLVFGLLLVGFVLLTYRTVRESRMMQVDAQLSAYAQKLLIEVEQDVDDDEPIEPDDFRKHIPEGLTDTRAQLFDEALNVVYKDSLLARLTAHPSAAVRGGEEEVVTVSLDAERRRMLWLPIEMDDEYPYILQVSASLKEIDADLNILLWLLLNTIPFALVVTGLIAYRLTKASLRPVEKMIENVQAITAQHLETRVQVPQARDEIQRLGETLNNLLTRIEAAFESQIQFVADASHELRTPLTVIRAELEFAQKHLQDMRGAESVTSAIQETARLERLTEQLLTLSWMDSAQMKLEKQTVRVDELVVECVHQVRSAALRKQVELQLFVAEAVELPGDSLRLKSAIGNLLENAVKYSPPGERVEVALTTQNGSMNTTLLKITDHGPGIPPAEHELIFKRFYRAKAQRGEANGSGLGLAIAQEIIALHGGRIAVTSQPGQGTTFTVELPLEQKA
jgi:signal transduction histidine kinase